MLSSILLLTLWLTVLKVGASISVDDNVAADASAAVESAWGLGATYVTSAGDTAVTIGAGISASEFKEY